MIWLLIACLIGQLTELGPTLSYTLDKVGNRESRASSIAAVAAATNSFNNRDWLSGDTYDASGNTTLSFAFNTQPDVYDFEDRLIIRRKLDGSTVNLSYDADGLLRQKTVFNSALTLVSATGYLQDTMNPTGYAQIMEERINAAAGTTVKLYAYGSDLISQLSSLNSQPATLSYFSYDGLGSVRELTNASGAITDAYDYDAFGILVYRVGTTDNAYLYRGERFESDIGQYYLRARFYNQNTGRFWNQDSYEGSASDPMSLHKYLYANGDGINNSDPTGHVNMAEVQIGMVIVGTLNGMAINSARNTLNQAGDIFNPTGEVAESLATLNEMMFVAEWLNYAAAGVGGGLLIKQGVVALWAKIGPKLPKAMDAISRLNPSKIFQAGLGQLRARARLESMRFSTFGEKKAVIGNFGGNEISGYDYKAFADSLGADSFYIEREIYTAMSPGQRLEANLAALDRFVAEGRTILVSTPQSLMRFIDRTGGPSGLSHELTHLFSKYGLVLSSDGKRLVPLTPKP